MQCSLLKESLAFKTSVMSRVYSEACRETLPPLLTLAPLLVVLMEEISSLTA
jgi:hypothetical protein